MIQLARLHQLIESFSQTAVLVIGDVMLDEYIWGKVSRISPEAPVPVVEVVSESQRLGGAANVLHNLHSLGGRPFICSVTGDDATGKELRSALKGLGVALDSIIIDPLRPTTIKTRIIAHHQQIARLDRESRQDLAPADTERLLGCIRSLLPQIDGIIIEDYGKGLITGPFLEQIVALATAAHKVVAVDPKTNHFDLYHGVSVITPNHHEAGAAAHLPIQDHESLLAVGKRLLAQLQCEYVLITRGEEGMSLFEQRRQLVTHVPTMAQEVYDVTGAGDTVIAALTLALASGANPVDATLLANAAAGVVVGKIGTATVSQQELQNQLLNITTHQPDIYQEPIP